MVNKKLKTSKHSINFLKILAENKLLILIGLGIIFLDQITKQLAKNIFINTGNHLVDITYTVNTGSLFSLFAGTPWVNIIFIALSFIGLGLMYYFFIDEEIKIRKIAYVVLSAGIVGNLINRILFGSVIDWINFHVWPVFNIADSALFIGVMIAMISIYREEKDKLRGPNKI